MNDDPQLRGGFVAALDYGFRRVARLAWCGGRISECLPATVVRADPLSLRRRVVNLVDNALKCGERARLNLHSGDGRVAPEIDDDGPGIPRVCNNVFLNHFSGQRLHVIATPVESASD